MTFFVDDPAALAQQLRDAAETANMAVVDAPVDGEGWQADWPATLPTTDYVPLAARSGASVLWLHTVITDQEWPDPTHRGDVGAIAAVWVADAVAVRPEVAAEWWAADIATQELSEDIERHEQEAQVESLARQIVSHEAFRNRSAARNAIQDAAVSEAFPDLDESMVWRVSRRAHMIDQAELQPAREAEWAAEGHAMLADGATKVATAQKFGISTNVLNRILQENPPAPST